MLTSETRHVLRSGCSLRVGRNHEYRHNPNALYIGDLKVPKTYITVRVARTDSPQQNQKSPLSIVFESKCTTKIGGVVYKLASKEAQAFEKMFHEDELLLVVNANQSERIKIRISWVPVTLLVSSRGAQHGGIVQESSLEQRVSKMMAHGIDLRTTADPMLALHYLALNSHVDYNLQIALLRAIPIVCEAWCDFVTTHLSNVADWLREPKLQLLLQPEKLFLVPDSRRTTMLEENTVVLDPTNAPPEAVSRLKNWLSCLGAENVIMVCEDVEIVKTELSHAPEVVVFVASDNKETVLFGKDVNTQENLWHAVTSVDVGILRFFGTRQLFAPEKRSVRDESPKKQRRVRRKIERVSDTDFFLFTPISSSIPPETETVEDPNLDNSLFSKLERIEALEKLASCVSDEPASKNSSSEPRLQSPLSQKNQDTNNQEGSAHHDVHVPSKRVSTPDASQEESQTKSPIAEASNGSLVIERLESNNANGLLAQKSFAEAVISTKKQAFGVAQEEANDSERARETPTCKVELFHLVPRKRTLRIATSFNLLYKGRRNFKTFTKKGTTPNFVTRTYISLQTDDGHVAFNNQCPDRSTHSTQKRDQDFSGEMPTVKGFQPQSSQLFVDAEGSDDEQFDVLQISLNRVQQTRNHLESQSPRGFDYEEDDIDNDDEVAFTFSKRS